MKCISASWRRSLEDGGRFLTIEKRVIILQTISGRWVLRMGAAACYGTSVLRFMGVPDWWGYFAPTSSSTELRRIFYVPG